MTIFKYIKRQFCKHDFIRIYRNRKAEVCLKCGKVIIPKYKQYDLSK